VSPRTDPRQTAKFLRGLTIGALIGAVLAGSSIWTRRQVARRSEVPEPTPAVGPGQTPPAPAANEQGSATRR
jgi:hypothetical protein